MTPVNGSNSRPSVTEAVFEGFSVGKDTSPDSKAAFTRHVVMLSGAYCICFLDMIAKHFIHLGNPNRQILLIDDEDAQRAAPPRQYL